MTILSNINDTLYDINILFQNIENYIYEPDYNDFLKDFNKIITEFRNKLEEIYYNKILYKKLKRVYSKEEKKSDSDKCLYKIIHIVIIQQLLQKI